MAFALWCPERQKGKEGFHGQSGHQREATLSPSQRSFLACGVTNTSALRTACPAQPAASSERRKPPKRARKPRGRSVCMPSLPALNPPPPTPTQGVDDPPTSSLLKRETGTHTQHYHPAYSFSLYGTHTPPHVPLKLADAGPLKAARVGPVQLAHQGILHVCTPSGLWIVAVVPQWTLDRCCYSLVDSGWIKKSGFSAPH